MIVKVDVADYLQFSKTAVGPHYIISIVRMKLYNVA